MEKAKKQRKKKKTRARVSLPDHVIFDQILSRLSVKTVIRFKSVSKSWYSTISSHEFAKSHLKLSHTLSSSSSSYQFIILTGDSLKFMVMPYDDKLKNNLKNPIELGFTLTDSRFDSKNEPIIKLVGCCDGLVCLICRFHMRLKNGHIKNTIGNFIICNPATHQWSEIAMPCFQGDCYSSDYWFGYIPSVDDYKSNQWSEIAMPCFQGHCYSSDYWFGYIPSVDDYKIVALIHIEFDRPCYDYFVYSMRIGKWKRIDNLVKVIGKNNGRLKKNSLVFHDVLYWSPRALHHDSCICGFDFVTEQVKQVPVMDWLSAYNVAEFFVANGCLSLCCFSDSDNLSDVWMLKQHDDWSSWEKSCTIQDDILDLFLVVPTGKFLAYDYYMGDGGWYLYDFTIIDIRKDTEEQCQNKSYIISSRDPLAFGGCFVESLVSPFGAVQPA